MGGRRLARRLIHVRWAYARTELDRPKSSYVRSVPMADQVAAVLDGLSRRPRFTSTKHLVFCTGFGERLHDAVIRKRFYAALAAAGLGHLRTKADPFVFHDLRHTFARSPSRSRRSPMSRCGWGTRTCRRR